MQIGVITNPNSRKNKGRPDRVARLRDAIGDAGEVHETADVDAIKPVLRSFLDRGVDLWVADGGDGALHWMIRQALEVQAERGKDVVLPLAMPTNGGTIDFVAKAIGIKGRAEGLLHTLRQKVEAGEELETVEIDTMRIDMGQVTADGEQQITTVGFAAAAGGVGQRFFSKYYADADPNPRTIVKVVSRGVMSAPVAFSPLRKVPGIGKVGQYAADVFEPARCRVFVDGEQLEGETFSGVHVASIAVNLGNVLRFFGQADELGKLHAIVGNVSPAVIVANIPRMVAGRALRGAGVTDRSCTTMRMEAVGDELLAPVIDGEYYRDIRWAAFSLGPRLRVPRIVAK